MLLSLSALNFQPLQKINEIILRISLLASKMSQIKQKDTFLSNYLISFSGDKLCFFSWLTPPFIELEVLLSNLLVFTKVDY